MIPPTLACILSLAIDHYGLFRMSFSFYLVNLHRVPRTLLLISGVMLIAKY